MVRGPPALCAGRITSATPSATNAYIARTASILWQRPRTSHCYRHYIHRPIIRVHYHAADPGGSPRLKTPQGSGGGSETLLRPKNVFNSSEKLTSFSLLFCLAGTGVSLGVNSECRRCPLRSSRFQRFPCEGPVLDTFTSISLLLLIGYRHVRVQVRVMGCWRAGCM